MKPIASISTTQYILDHYHLQALKKYGQNFLIDVNVVEKIVACGNVDQNTAVIEVGPGIGALTQILSQYAGHVYSYEIDERFKPVYHDFIDQEKVDIIFEDFLSSSLDKIEKIKEKYSRVILVANLPYYITTQIIEKIVYSQVAIDEMIVMVQKEVALRMVAKPGTKDYGALSVAVQYYTKPDIVLDVPPKSFLPAPAVTSSVIRCVLRDKPPVDVVDEKLFFRVVKAGFAQRRKTFANTMKTTGLSKDRIEELLAKANIDGQRRGETFTLQEFADVANAWAALIK